MVMDRAVYVDASALVKVVATEEQSRALASYLGSRTQIASSRIVLVEVPPPFLRLGLQPSPKAVAILAAVIAIDVSPAIVQRAARLLPPELRALDAIHAATALELGSGIAAFVTYARRLAAAATALGLPVVSPS